MNLKILNIHGYGGSAQNTVFRLMDELYPSQVVSPQIDYDTTSPDTVVSILDKLIRAESVGAIVGTSFGGFFACCVGSQYEVPIILVNPCLLPFITLRQISDTYNLSKYGKRLFELFGQHMGVLDKRYLSTIVGKSDEIINHQSTTAYLVKSKRWYEIDGNHQIGRTNELSAAFREIFNYYEEKLGKCNTDSKFQKEIENSTT